MRGLIGPLLLGSVLAAVVWWQRGRVLGFTRRALAVGARSASSVRKNEDGGLVLTGDEGEIADVSRRVTEQYLRELAACYRDWAAYASFGAVPANPGQPFTFGTPNSCRRAVLAKMDAQFSGGLYQDILDILIERELRPTTFAEFVEGIGTIGAVFVATVGSQPGAAAAIIAEQAG